MNAPKEKSLRFNFSWTLLGNAVFVLCQWGIIVLLAREDAALIGQYALGLAVATPAFALSSLALRPLHVTDASQQYRFGTYLALRLILTSVVFAGLALFFSTVRADSASSSVVIAVAAIKGFETISDLIYGFFQKLERMDHIAQSKMLKGIATVSTLLIALMQGLPLVVALTLVFGMRVLIFIAFDLVQCVRFSHRYQSPLDELKPFWELSPLVNLLYTAMPMGIVLFFISLTQHMPNLFLEGYYGEATLGFFATLGSILIAGNQVVSALGESASPRLAKQWNPETPDAFYWLLGKLIAIAAAMGAIGTLVVFVAGNSILSLIFDPEYAEYTVILVYLMISSIFSYPSIMLGYGATASRRLRRQPWAILFVTLITLIASLLLIPEYGIDGAAYTVIISSVARVFAYAALFGYETDGS